MVFSIPIQVKTPQTKKDFVAVLSWNFGDLVFVIDIKETFPFI